MLNLIDEFTHECLAIRVDRKLKSAHVIDVLSDQFILRGVPEHIRSDARLPLATAMSSAVRCWQFKCLTRSDALRRRELPTFSIQKISGLSRYGPPRQKVARSMAQGLLAE